MTWWSNIKKILVHKENHSSQIAAQACICAAGTTQAIAIGTVSVIRKLASAWIANQGGFDDAKMTEMKPA